MSRATPDASNLLPGRFGRGVGLAPPCATADQKQGAQPSASPFAPALLTHFDFYSKRLCFAIEDAQSGESGLDREEYKRRLPFTRWSSCQSRSTPRSLPLTHCTTCHLPLRYTSCCAYRLLLWTQSAQRFRTSGSSIVTLASNGNHHVSPCPTSTRFRTSTHLLEQSRK
jgi:hypothetical protein